MFFGLAAIQESTRLVLQKAQAFTDIRHLRRSLKEIYNFGAMVSKTPAMHKVFEIIQTVAGTDMTVVVEGETGTGKELVARTIHDLSPRQMKPFVAINCAGFVESLLESELWLRKGSVYRRRPGTAREDRGCQRRDPFSRRNREHLSKHAVQASPCARGARRSAVGVKPSGRG